MKQETDKNIPKFFTDLKYDNFGVIGKQFVCLDYGTISGVITKRSLDDKKLKRAKWWNNK